jgi:hypothetical protein
MEKKLEGTSQVTGRIPSNNLWRGLGWGVIGGFAGTMVMDLVLMGALAALGSPALTCFSIVGNTVSRFFSLQGVDIAKSIQLGILTHYLVGPLIGAIFGTVTSRIEALRVGTLKKTLLVAIVYVEILSQPMLAMTPILLKMTVPATLQWYAGSFMMHLMAGGVLGAVMGRGLRLAPAANRR